MNKPVTETRKWVRVLLIFALCFAFGTLTGAMVGKLNGAWDLAGWLEKAVQPLYIALSCVYIAAVAFVLSLSACQLHGLTRRITALDPDDEEQIETIERQLNTPILLTNVLMIVGLAMMPVLMALSLRDSVTKAVFGVLFPADMVMFLVNLLGVFILQKRVIDQEKRLNPEKRGSLLDASFSKTWEQSCDEGEKLTIYRAGYRAYTAGSMACLILWLIGMVCMFALDTGVLPMVMVCIVWLVMTAAYHQASAR